MKKIALLTVTILLFSFTNAQTSLIETGNKQLSDFSEYSSLFANYLASTDYESIEIGTVWNLESCVMDNEAFYIEIHGHQATWMPTIVNHKGNSSYYGGMLDGDVGNLSLLYTENGISGRLNINNDAYGIVQLENNYVLLAKFSSDLGISNCEVLDGPQSAGSSTGSCSLNQMDICQAVLTVLCVANQEAFDWLEFRNEEWEFYIEKAEGRMNEILINSGIQNKRFQLFAHPTVTGINDNINLSSSVHYSSTMQDLRNNYHADILFHYCRRIPDAADGMAYCSGALNGNPVAISEISRDNSIEINLPHEIGHLFGITHQDGKEQCAVSSCHDAWDIFTQIGAPVKRVTSVWTGSGTPGEYSRRYSNPFVQFQNLSAGIVNQHFSARQLANNFCDVADLNTSLDFIVDIITTPNIGEDPNCPESYTLQASHNVPGPGLPGQPSYSYEWRSSTIPFFSSTFPGIAESDDGSFTFEHPGNSFPNTYIQLKVTGSDGFSLTSVIYLKFCPITIDPDWPEFRKMINSEELKIYPNPRLAESGIDVAVFVPENTTNLEVITLSSKLVFSTDVVPLTSKVILNNEILHDKGLYIILAKNKIGTVISSEFLINQ